MTWLFTLLPSLLKFLNGVSDWFRDRRDKADARAVAGAEVAAAEAEATREAAVIVSEHRDPSDAAKRLDKGTF